jgi:hypothetical protein
VAPRPPDLAAAVAAAQAAAPGTSAVALEAVRAALGSPREEVRAAALATLGFAAAERVFAAFRAAVTSDRAALAQLDEARALRGAAGPVGPSPAECVQPAAPDDEMAALRAAACAGFDRGQASLAAALGAGSRPVRRTAAALLRWTDAARAVPVLEAAIRRALATDDLTAAVDCAEALLGGPAP